MAATIACPYCNAYLPRPASVPPGGRVLCPRCGERFPYRPTDELGEATASPVAASEAPAEDRPPPPTRPVSNTAIAATVLGVMAVMAVVGLIFALQTEPVRRAHDRDIGKPQLVSVPLLVKIAGNAWVVGLVVLLLSLWWNRVRRGRGEAPAAASRFRWALGMVAVLFGVSIVVSMLAGPIRRQSSQFTGAGELPVIRVRTPAQMEAVGYLPADCNVVAAVDVADLLQSPMGRDFLANLNIGPLDFAPDEIEKWSGLKAEELDHVALGVRVDDLLVPRPILVVRTRAAYDAAAVLQALKAVRVPESGRKDRYRFRFGRLDAGLWCPPDGRTLVFALTPKELDAAQPEPKPGLEHLSRPLREFLGERVNQPTPGWLAAHSDQWDKTVFHSWLLTQPPREQQAFTGLRTVGLWFTLDRDATVNMAAAWADAAAAESLAAYLEQRAAPLLKGVKLLRKENWVSGQARGDPEAVLRVFRADHAPPADR